MIKKNIILAVILALCMAFGLYVVAAPVLEAAEISDSELAADSANIASSEAVPGKNVFTGSDYAVTFDSASDLDNITVSPRWMPTAVVESGIKSGVFGNSLYFNNKESKTDASGHFVVSVKLKADYTVDRPAFMIAAVNDACTQWYMNGKRLRENLAGGHVKGYIKSDTGADRAFGSDTVAYDVWAIYSNNYNMYLDNVALIPYYEITYKNIYPDGSAEDDAVKYYLDTASIAVSTADGKISGLPEYYTPDEALSYEGYVLSGWSTEENASKAMDKIPLANEDITLYPVWKTGEDEEDTEPDEATVTPGINVLTGSDKAITFDSPSDLDNITVSPKWMPSATVESGIKSAVFGNSLYFNNKDSKTDASGHFVVSVRIKAGVTVDRPAFMIAAVSDACTQWYMNGNKIRENLAGSHTKGYIKSDSGADKAFGSDTVSCDVWAIYSNNYNMYIDNVALIPYYKVTYKNILPDGSSYDDTVKFELDTESIAVSTADGVISGLPKEYVPDEELSADGYMLYGWSTEEGAQEPMTVIPLENSDIVLYPVWKEYSGEEDALLTVKGETEITIDGRTRAYTAEFSEGFPDKSVKWSVNNEEIAEIDENTGILTVKQQGTVKITAKSVYNHYVFANLDVNISYAYFKAEISGPSEIVKASRSEMYSFEITDGDVSVTEVKWSVDNPLVAEIDENTGRLSPKSNGTVTVTAFSVSNPYISASLTVEVSGQSEVYTVTYLAGTQSVVSGLPEPEFGTRGFTLSDKIPERDGYVFLGWTLSEDSTETVSEIVLSENTNVYGLWGKGYCLEFNGNTNGITGVSGGRVTASDTYAVFDTTGTNGDIRVSFGTLNINPDTHKRIYIRMAVDKKNYTQIFYKSQLTDVNGETKLYGYNENGYADAETYAVMKNHENTGLDNWFTLDFNMYGGAPSAVASWHNGKADLIKNMWLDLTNKADSLVYVDYIRILDTERSISFEPGADDVSGMPEEMTAEFGSKMTVSEIPERDGYSFVGWTKYPGDRASAKKAFTVTDDMTLYAVWDKLVEITDGNTAIIGEIDTDTFNAVLVKAARDSEITLTYTYQNETHTLTAVTGLRGYAVFDLSDEDGIITDAVVTADSTIRECLITDVSSAEKTAVGSSQSTIGSSDTGKMEYDKTVTGLTKPGTIKPNGSVGLTVYDGKEEAVEINPISFEGVTDTIIVNFDDVTDTGIWAGLRNVKTKSVENSELTVNVQGTNSSSAALTTSDIMLDASSHRYVVIKAKSLNLSSDKLRMYFVSSKGNGKYSVENSAVVTISDDYGMLIFDMSEYEDWDGEITRLMFSFIGVITGDFKIDWIMFTDSLPAHMDDVSGVHEMFPTANRNEMPFTDIATDDWFYGDVAKAYRLGFVKGVSDTVYNPEGAVTIAEAVTVAERLNRIYNGEATLPESEDGMPWYSVYVNEAKKKGIIGKDGFADYTLPASRKEVAQMIYKALPVSWFGKINVFNEIPDLEKTDSAYKAVLAMYNAGVLIGNDDKYNFLPEESISRAELAAILGRTAVPDSRIRVVTDAERKLLRKTFYAEDLVGSVSIESCTAYGFVMKDGLASATSRTRDPIVYIGKLMGEIDGSVYRSLRIGMKWDKTKVPNPTGNECSLFFTTPSGSWSDARRIRPTWDGKTDENGVGELVFNLSSNKQFADVITNMRFDPFDASEVDFAIEYIIIE